MPIRITGMNSGLDTESIISELVKAKSAKKDDLVKAQTKLEWKQDAWKELNSKVYALYSKTLSNMRLKSDYSKKSTKVSNSSAASVITGTKAVNGVQTLSVDQVATTGYLTGAQIGEKNQFKSSDKMTAISDFVEDGSEITVKVGTNEETKITIDQNMTIDDFVTKLKEAGLNASFDEKNQRFFISSKNSGAEADFEISGDDEVLRSLGLATQAADLAKYDENNKYCELKDGKYVVKEGLDDEEAAKAAQIAKILNRGRANKISGQDAQITLNGAVFTSDSNTFEINGLTITAMSEASNITVTTEDDTEGIYDMVKNFLKEYNTLINEMDSLYNADSAKGYEPLTDEEKEALSEKEVEKWEEKIKKAILRKDSTLSTVASAMKQVMSQGVELKDKDGNVTERVYLNEFGIGTLGYFTAKDNEKNAYHIDGDPDDESTMTNADKLKTAIANDPERVIDVFSTLAMNLYNKIGDLMKKTEYSSSFTLYDDVAMKDEYKDYTSKIQRQEQKITDFEDRYYKKFSAMETALAKLSSKESAISGLLGM